ncbi:HAD family hydrolase [Clostridioides difficile]
MENIYFITDLDRTIIHSKNKGYRCVEMMGEREITYMTDESYNKLQELLKNNSFIFIPCTMRNIKQTLRVDFIREYNPQIIICTNGAQIYINGQLDKEWDKKIKSLCDYERLNDNIKYLLELKENHKEDIKVLEVRNIEDFYITIKCEDSIEAEKFYEIIKDNFDEELIVLRIDAKIFIIHNEIDKVHAVDYVIDKFNIKRLITAGDSAVDEQFTKRGISILPKHSSFKHEKSIITEKNNIKSTEDILEIICSIVE